VFSLLCRGALTFFKRVLHFLIKRCRYSVELHSVLRRLFCFCELNILKIHVIGTFLFSVDAQGQFETQMKYYRWQSGWKINNKVYSIYTFIISVLLKVRTQAHRGAVLTQAADSLSKHAIMSFRRSSLSGLTLLLLWDSVGGKKYHTLTGFGKYISFLNT